MRAPWLLTVLGLAGAKSRHSDQHLLEVCLQDARKLGYKPPGLCDARPAEGARDGGIPDAKTDHITLRAPPPPAADNDDRADVGRWREPRALVAAPGTLAAAGARIFVGGRFDGASSARVERQPHLVRL